MHRLGRGQIGRMGVLVGVVCFFVVLDQWTKAMVMASMVLQESIDIIPGFFSLTYVRNFGISFGLLSHLSPTFRVVFILVVPVVVLVALVLVFFSKGMQTRVATLGLALIIAGAVGNLLDRFIQGFVVDFLLFDLGFMTWPAFNVADICVTVGGVWLLVFFSVFRKPDGRHRA